MGLLDGKTAIITGAGGGIGREHALLFAREGAAVVVNDLGGARDGVGAENAPADRVAAEIRAAGGRAAASYDSVSDPAGAEHMVEIAMKQFGGVDILVNNAGILRDKSFKKMEVAMFDAVIAVHLRGSFCCAQAVFRRLADRNAPGAIVNTTSISGLMGNFGQANYASAKAGIYGLTRTIAIEGQKGGIRCNAIAPVAFTRMTQDLPMFSGRQEDYTPRSIAEVALFLASDLSKPMTGRVLGVQGGQVFEWKMIHNQADALSRDPARKGHWTAREIAANVEKVLIRGIPDAAPPETQK
ncbi:MAG: SDR family oxidoreductase [Planctomycetes bacterium]|nr:SDR family oxidoreductase [Planctomycetota bacterium]